MIITHPSSKTFPQLYLFAQNESHGTEVIDKLTVHIPHPGNVRVIGKGFGRTTVSNGLSEALLIIQCEKIHRLFRYKLTTLWSLIQKIFTLFSRKSRNRRIIFKNSEAKYKLDAVSSIWKF